MGVTMTGDPMFLHKILVKAEKEDIIEMMISEGEKAVERMRSGKDYIDRTGALTSSMGYIVSNGGVIEMANGFDLSGGGYAGQDAGRLYASQLAKEVQDGVIALIVLAGMDYGGHLESEDRKWKKGSPYKVVIFTEEETRNSIEKRLENIF